MSCEGDGQARSTADAVARRSYGKLVAFLAARTRDRIRRTTCLPIAFAAHADIFQIGRTSTMP